MIVKGQKAGVSAGRKKQIRSPNEASKSFTLANQSKNMSMFDSLIFKNEAIHGELPVQEYK